MIITKALSKLLAFSFIALTLSCGKSGDSNYNGNDPNYGGVTIYITSAMQYTPHPITVQVGTKVRWRNNDNSVHTATADDGTFTTRDIAPGRTDSLIMNVLGTFPYHCSHHSNMRAEIRVTQ
jgi:plastocyanin